MELDVVDRRILYELERDARIPDVRLARLCRKSKDAVRYRIRKLEERGYIRRWQTWVDYGRLGLRSATLTLRTLSLHSRMQELIAEIRRDPRVSWLGVAQGAWNVAATYTYKDNKELFAIKNDLLVRYSDLVIDSDLAFVVDVHVHEKSFLLEQHSSFIRFIGEQEPVTIDDASKAILRELLQDCRTTMSAIAHRTGLSLEAVRSRVRKLEEQRVIVRYCGLPDYTKLGIELYKAHVYLAASPAQMEGILRFCEQSPQIIHVVQQLAPWDLELVVFVRSSQEYAALIERLSERFARIIKRVETAAMSEDIVLPSGTLLAL